MEEDFTRSVICMMGSGYGTRAIRCMSRRIAGSWMRDSGARRMGGRMTPTPSGDGSRSIAIYRGFVFYNPLTSSSLNLDSCLVLCFLMEGGRCGMSLQ